jgi:tRNA threonylcarbamoyladenosine biosynthesis protein TsaE
MGVFIFLWLRYSFYMTEHIRNIAELEIWLGAFLSTLEKKDMATIISLCGEVGAGKTTFTQLLAKNIGITEYITSPTFVIQKEYSVEHHHWIKKLIHIDAYRLEHKNDLEYLGWNQLIHNPEYVIVIEWPEMVSGIDMPQVIKIEIVINDDHSRTLIF